MKFCQNKNHSNSPFLFLFLWMTEKELMDKMETDKNEDWFHFYFM